MSPRPSPLLTRRHLQLGLGLIWILDAALQFQPFMFSHRFGVDVIGSAASGQPELVAAGVRTVARVINVAPAVANFGFALVQLSIGLGLLHRRSARWALVGSLAWPLGIWYFGEGLGGVLSGHASLITGAPGAALLYAIVAVAAWVPRRSDWGFDQPPSQYVLVGWAVVWGIGALLQGLPGQASAGALAASLRRAGQSDPGWIGPAASHAAAWIAGGGEAAVALLISAEVVVALAVFAGGRAARTGAWAGGLVALILWGLGQGFGEVFSGQSTDPNTGPLLILMAAAVYGWAGSAPPNAAATTYQNHRRRLAISGLARNGDYAPDAKMARRRLHFD